MLGKYSIIPLIVIVFLATTSVFASGYTASLPDGIKKPCVLQATGAIEVAFSPSGGITQMIINEITVAKKSIEVQAYSFTSRQIIAALVNARKRGVLVRVILDHSQETRYSSSIPVLVKAGIPVHIDRSFKIANNKIIIVDRKDTITGSFNFTKASETNSENMLILRDNQTLANIYETNWQWRWDATSHK